RADIDRAGAARHNAAICRHLDRQNRPDRQRQQDTDQQQQALPTPHLVGRRVLSARLTPAAARSIEPSASHSTPTVKLKIENVENVELKRIIPMAFSIRS